MSVPAQAQDILLADGNVVDVRTGISEVASVLVRNGVIQEVTGSPTVPPGVPVVDASGKWVIPGLIELHSHTVDPTALQRALALGVTSALTLYTGLEFLPPGLEDPSHVAGNPSPRIHMVGGRFRVVDSNAARRGSPGRLLAPASPAEAVKYLDMYRAEGVTRVKIWLDDGTVQKETVEPTFEDSVLIALVDGAKARNMDVYYHALTGELYRRALATEPSWLIHPMVTEELAATDIAILKAAGLGWTTVMSIVLWRGDPVAFATMALADPRLIAAMSRSQLERYRLMSASTENPHAAGSPRIAERVYEYLANIGRSTVRLQEEGVTIAVGSDIGAGYGTHLEIELLRDAGLEASAILRAATLGGAEALGIADRFGSIEPGKVADIVVLSSDPLLEITNLRDVDLVLKGGHRWQPAELLAETMR